MTRSIAALALAVLPFVGACDSALTRPSLYSTVSVVVTQRDGTGIPGASLVLYTGDRPMGYGTTNSSGEFSFTRVPKGVYGVTAAPPAGYALLETLLNVPPSNSVDQVVVQGDTVRPLHFTFLSRGPGVVVARVVETNGAPLSDVAVTLYDATAIRGKSRTGADGRAVFTAVPFGLYGVSVERPVFFRDFRVPGDSAVAFRDNLVVEGGARDSVSIALAKCAGSIRLTALDQNGAPVVGATALAYTATAALASKQTAADGRATFDVPCVTQLGVSIVAPTGYSVVPGRGTSFIDGFTVTVGQVADVTLRLVRSP